MPKPAAPCHATRRAALGAGLLAAALAAACGGGEQVQTFEPTRMLALGDESSVVLADGRKYGVNALVAGTTTIDCASNPIWVQFVAGRYGLVFPECNPNNVASPTSRILAVPGATVAGVVTQIDAQAAAGFTDRDLVSVLVGANDVLTQYQRLVAGADLADVTARVEEAGTALGLQVNRIAGLGAKVLLSTVPDLGLTPFARAQEALVPGRAATLTALTKSFNDKLRLNIVNDGRKIGLVLLDERIQLIVKVTTSLSFSNVTGAACAVALPDCNTSTLVVDPASTATPPANANGTTWLWADGTHLSAGGQSAFGALAADRAADNPF